MMGRIAAVALLVCALGVAGSAWGQVDDQPTGLDPGKLTELDLHLQAAIKAGEFAEAREAAEAILAERPKDPFVRFDLARALASLGEGERSVEALLDAISYGYTDFHRMDRDPLLAGARSSPGYARIIAGWAPLLDQRGQANLEGMKASFAEGYTFASDDALRLHFASAVNAESFDAARGEIGRVADFVRAEGLFGPLTVDAARPHAWVSVLIPTPADFRRVLGASGVGGIYQDQTRRLIVRDIGPSLRHEFFHVLHHRHMSELSQTHAYWIMEGMACLVEDVSGEGDSLVIEPSWRSNIASRLARSGTLIDLEDFARFDRSQFVGERARARYAQARAVFMYMHSRGKLAEWYRAYCATFDEDPTGLRAIEAAFGVPAREFDREFRVWARDIPEVAEASRPADVTLPFEVRPGPADGLAIVGNPPKRAVLEGDRLRDADVVLAIDAHDTRTMDDLYRILGPMVPGQAVRLAVRRGDARFEVLVRLVKPPEE